MDQNSDLPWPIWDCDKYICLEIYTLQTYCAVRQTEIEGRLEGEFDNSQISMVLVLAQMKM